jgi:hypothetical protein
MAHTRKWALQSLAINPRTNVEDPKSDLACKTALESMERMFNSWGTYLPTVVSVTRSMFCHADGTEYHFIVIELPNEVYLKYIVTTTTDLPVMVFSLTDLADPFEVTDEDEDSEIEAEADMPAEPATPAPAMKIARVLWMRAE